MKLSIARVSVSSWTAQTSSKHRLPRHRLPFVINQVAQQVDLHQGQRQRPIANPQLLLGVEANHLAGEREPVRRPSERLLQSTKEAAEPCDQDWQARLGFGR